MASISIIANEFTDDGARPQLEAALCGPDGLLPAGAHPALPHDSEGQTFRKLFGTKTSCLERLQCVSSNSTSRGDGP